MTQYTELNNIARNTRLDILRLAHKAGRKGAHIAPSLSMVDFLTVLFNETMDHQKDKFVLSKGHGGLGYYAALAQAGLISKEQLDTFEDNGGFFPGQPARSENNGIIYSSGTLGLGLSYGAGIAWDAKYIKKKPDHRVFVVLGDGEINEGSIWEAAMFAKHQNLDNLIAIVDCNKMQSDGFSAEILDYNINSVWTGFSWQVNECNGHDMKEIHAALNVPSKDQPTVIIAHTIKGKGISFMENNRAWHHSQLNQQQYEDATSEVRANGN